MFKYIMEITIGTLLIITMVSQVIVPLIFNMDLFWFFKKSRPNLDSISKVADELKEKESLVHKAKEDLDESTKKVDDTIELLTKIKNQQKNN